MAQSDRVFGALWSVTVISGFIKRRRVIVAFTVSFIFACVVAPYQVFATSQAFRSSNNIETSNSSAKFSGVSGDFVYYSQNDTRWSNKPYGTSIIGPSGCGPTSMAMIASTLTDTAITPEEMAILGASKGSFVEGVGTAHLPLIKAASEKWGLKYEDITSKDVSAAIAVVKAGGLVYLSGAGPAPFTAGGHIVVMRGVTADGKIIIADPYGGDPFVKRAADNTYSQAHIEKYRGSAMIGIYKK